MIGRQSLADLCDLQVASLEVGRPTPKDDRQRAPHAQDDHIRGPYGAHCGMQFFHSISFSLVECASLPIWAAYVYDIIIMYICQYFSKT